MSKSYSLNELAELLDARVEGDGAVCVSKVATLQNASAQQIAFLSNSKYRKHLKDTRAGAVLLGEDDLPHCPSNALVHKNPYVAFARLAQLLDDTPPIVQGVAPTAFVAASARLGKNVALAHNVVIEDDVVIGDNVQIGTGSFIGQGTHIGADSKVYQNVTIYHHSVIGNAVTIHSNTVIGSDGFGYANDAGQWLKIPQTGRVVIGDNSEIGASSSIDRGALEDTLIGSNVIIDNQVQIGHNVEIGDGSCVCGQTGIAGSVTIGKYVIVAGGCGINGHISIHDNVQITGFSMITKDIKAPGLYSSGLPASTNKEWRRSMVRIRQLDSLFDRVKQLEAATKPDAE